MLINLSDFSLSWNYARQSRFIRSSASVGTEWTSTECLRLDLNPCKSSVRSSGSLLMCQFQWVTLEQNQFLAAWLVRVEESTWWQVLLWLKNFLINFNFRLAKKLTVLYFRSPNLRNVWFFTFMAADGFHKVPKRVRIHFWIETIKQTRES